jgi:lipoprotein-releasing system permease protein
MALSLAIAMSHLRSRKRQTIASMLGVAMAVGFFIAISGVMTGFQDYFRTKVIEASPHIVISDEFRSPAEQPLVTLHPGTAVEVDRVVLREATRGILGLRPMLQGLEATPGVIVSPVLRGQLLLRRAGRDFAVSALGIEPAQERQVTTLSADMIRGTLEALAAVPNGVIVGEPLARRMNLAVGDSITAAAVSSGSTMLKVVGLFRTGLEQIDDNVVYVGLAKQQSMQARPRTVNEIRLHLADASRSIPLAAAIEGRWAYKTMPWEESNSRLLDTFALQNLIIYTTIAAILIVAGFGIFNIISMVVLEKARDIAILRSIGFSGGDIGRIFVTEGVVVGVVGALCGWGLGFFMTSGLATLPVPGATDPGQTLIVSQSYQRYLAGTAFALVSAIVAAWLPARKAARANPLSVIRGAT